MGETLEHERKRLLYRATHRGTRELDLVIGGFARAHVHAFSAAECAAFQEVMDLPETDLQAWLMGQDVCPADKRTPLMEQLLNYRVVAQS